MPKVQLEDLGVKPIREDEPVGTDVTYEPEFEELQGEIEKLSSPTAETTDWSKVVGLAWEILSEKAKDLRVATYLSIGLLETEGLEGFSRGVKVLKDLLENFWEGMYPPLKRVRGRVRALEWWAERAAAYLKRVQVPQIPEELASKIKEGLDGIDQALAERLEEPPFFGELRELLDRIPVIAPKKEEPSAAPKAAVTEVSSVEDAQRAMRDALQTLRKVAGLLRGQEPTSPLPYRLMRFCCWGPVDVLPPQEDGKTRLPPPPAQLQSQLQELESQGNWEGLLNLAEGRFPQFIYWLDLQRWVVQGMAGLGEEFSRAREAVEAEVASFIRRLPELPSLSFSDGTPFANEATAKWLEGLRGGGGKVQEPSTVTSGGEDDPLAQAEADARAAMRRGDLQGAVEIIQDGLRSAPSAKDRFLWRMALVRLLLKAKKGDLLLPQIFELDREVKEFRLEEWDPDMAVKALSLIWQGLTMGTGRRDRAQMEELLSRIARLNVLEAMRLKA